MKKTKIIMMDQLPGLRDEEMENLTREEFDRLSAECLRKGDMDSYFRLHDRYPRFGEAYIFEGLCSEE